MKFQFHIWIPVVAALIVALVKILSIIFEHLAKSPKKRPLPEKFEALLPRTSLDLVKNMFPGIFNHLSNMPYYRILLKDEYFRLARCFINESLTSSIIRTVLYFKDESSCSCVKQAALNDFGITKVISTPADCLIWIISGYKVKINNQVYEVQKATVPERVGFFFYRLFKNIINALKILY